MNEHKKEKNPEQSKKKLKLIGKDESLKLDVEEDGSMKLVEEKL